MAAMPAPFSSVVMLCVPLRPQPVISMPVRSGAGACCHEIGQPTGTAAKYLSLLLMWM